MDSNSCFEHVFEFRQVRMSFSQSLAFSFGRNTRNLRVSISHPRMTFLSASVPSAKCLVMLMISFLVVASSLSTGLKNASKASGTECFNRSVLSSMSTPAWKMSSMKLSLTISLGGNGTDRLFACSNGMFFGRNVGGLFTNLKFECRVFVDHVGSRDKSHATSVIVSLIMLKIEGAGDEPKGSLTSKYAMSFTIVMHVTAAFIDACILLYAASMSVLLITIALNGCRLHML
jgi:hypothetical protein